MTKEDIDIAATLGIPVVRRLSEAEESEKERYTIYQYGKRYPEAQERKRGKKAVQFVVLLDSCRRWTDSKPELIDPADPEMFEAQKQAYLAGTIPKHEEPEKPKAKRKVFEKPSVEDVAAYAAENLLNVNARAFWDHYEACGWVVGKNKPMKSWQAAVRQWDRRETEFSGRSASDKPEPAQSSFETDAFFEAALAKSYAGDI